MNGIDLVYSCCGGYRKWFDYIKKDKNMIRL